MELSAFNRISVLGIAYVNDEIHEFHVLELQMEINL